MCEEENHVRTIYMTCTLFMCYWGEALPEVKSAQLVSERFFIPFDSILHVASRGRISGRGFLGLSQSGVSAHEFDSEPSAVSSSENEGMAWSNDEPVRGYVH